MMAAADTSYEQASAVAERLLPDTTASAFSRQRLEHWRATGRAPCGGDDGFEAVERVVGADGTELVGDTLRRRTRDGVQFLLQRGVITPAMALAAAQVSRDREAAGLRLRMSGGSLAALINTGLASRGGGDAGHMAVVGMVAEQRLRALWARLNRVQRSVLWAVVVVGETAEGAGAAVCAPLASRSARGRAAGAALRGALAVAADFYGIRDEEGLPAAPL